MYQNSSIARYLQNEYQCIFEHHLVKYAYRIRPQLESSLQRIYEIKHIVAYELNVKDVIFVEDNGSSLKLRALINVYFIISGWSYLGYQKEMIFKQFAADLAGPLSNLTITNVEVKDDLFYFDYEDSFSNYLIPCVSYDNLDQYAEGFLKKYCPQALDTPMAIPAADIIRAMGLSLYYAPLPKNIVGRTYFKDAVVNVCMHGTLVSQNIPTGSILLYEDILKQSAGFISNTIIHECLHWELHKRHFEIKKIIDGQDESISCDAEYNPAKNAGFPSEEYKIMEWQASHISPRILIPTCTGRPKLIEIIKAAIPLYDSTNKIEFVQSVIRQFADYFQVSIAMAKIRAIELGFNEARGVFNYVNGQYTQPFSLDSSSSKQYIYTVSHENIIALYKENAEIAHLCHAGLLIHADGMLVINDPKYVLIRNGFNPKLTEYALSHVSECCIAFKALTRTNYDKSSTDVWLSREIDASTYIEVKYNSSYGNNENVVKLSAELATINAEIKRITALVEQLPSTLHGTINFHIKRKGYTTEKAAELCEISSRRLQTLRSKPNTKCEVRTVISLCIGLNLHPAFAYDLLHKAGIDISSPTRDNLVYRLLIDNYHMENITKWQAMLAAMDLSHLLPCQNKDRL